MLAEMVMEKKTEPKRKFTKAYTALGHCQRPGVCQILSEVAGWHTLQRRANYCITIEKL